MPKRCLAISLTRLQHHGGSRLLVSIARSMEAIRKQCCSEPPAPHGAARNAGAPPERRLQQIPAGIPPSFTPAAPPAAPAPGLAPTALAPPASLNATAAPPPPASTAAPLQAPAPPAPPGAAAAGNLTVTFFECCESPASAGTWDAIELWWRAVEGDKESDRTALVALTDASGAASAALAGACKSPMNCEQYIALDAAGARVLVPAGVQHWTRFRDVRGGAALAWQYQGRAYDGDGDGQVEVLVCGDKTRAEGGSAWFQYSCSPTAACSIVAHPCCVSGDCITGDSGEAVSVGSYNPGGGGRNGGSRPAPVPTAPPPTAALAAPAAPSGAPPAAPTVPLRTVALQAGSPTAPAPASNAAAPPAGGAGSATSSSPGAGGTARPRKGNRRSRDTAIASPTGAPPPPPLPVQTPPPHNAGMSFSGSQPGGAAQSPAMRAPPLLDQCNSPVAGACPKR